MASQFIRQPLIILSIFLLGLSTNNSYANESFSSTPIAKTATQALETCLKSKLSDEASKNSPSSQALLNYCFKEYSALENELPPAARNEIKQFIKNAVTKKLNSEKDKKKS